MPKLCATTILQDLKELSNFTDGEINNIASDTASELENEWLTLIKDAVISIANRSSKKTSCEKKVDSCNTHGVPDIAQFFNRKSNVKASIFLHSDVEREHVHKDKNVRFVETTDHLTESKTKGPLICEIYGNHNGSSPIQTEAKTVNLGSNIQEISGSCRTYLSRTNAPVTSKDENKIPESQNKSKKVNVVIYETPSKSGSNSTIGCFTQVLDKKFKSVCVPTIAVNEPTSLDDSSVKRVNTLNETVIVEGKSCGSNVTKNTKALNETVILEGNSCGRSAKNIEELSSKNSHKLVLRKMMGGTSKVENVSEAKSLKNTSRFNTPVVSLLASRNHVAPSLGLTSMLLKSSVEPVKKEKDKMKEIKIKEEKADENLQKVLTMRQKKLEESKKKRQEKVERTAEKRLKLENEKKEKYVRQLSRHEISLSVKKEPVVKKGRKRKSNESQDEKMHKKYKKKDEDEENATAHCKPAVTTLKENKPSGHAQRLNERKSNESQDEKMHTKYKKKDEDEENATAHCKPAVTTLKENKPSGHAQRLNERNCAESNSGKIIKKKSEKEKSIEICGKSNVASLPKNKPVLRSGEERKVESAIKTPQSASVKTKVLDKESCVTPKTPNANSKRNTPEVAKTPIRKEDEIVSYDMTPIPENESSDEENEAARARKKIPTWAQGVLLKTALINQHYYPLDTDELFGTVTECPDLTKIFGQKKKYYCKRTSSAIWHSPPFVET